MSQSSTANNLYIGSLKCYPHPNCKHPEQERKLFVSKGRTLWYHYDETFGLISCFGTSDGKPQWYHSAKRRNPVVAAITTSSNQSKANKTSRDSDQPENEPNKRNKRRVSDHFRRSDNTSSDESSSDDA